MKIRGKKRRIVSLFMEREVDEVLLGVRGDRMEFNVVGRGEKILMVYEWKGLWIVRDRMGVLIEMMVSWRSRVMEKEVMKVLGISKFRWIVFGGMILKL